MASTLGQPYSLSIFLCVVFKDAGKMIKQYRVWEWERTVLKLSQIYEVLEVILNQSWCLAAFNCKIRHVSTPSLIRSKEISQYIVQYLGFALIDTAIPGISYHPLYPGALCAPWGPLHNLGHCRINYLWSLHHSHHCHNGWAEPEGLLQAAVQIGQLHHLKHNIISKKHSKVTATGLEVILGS